MISLDDFNSLAEGSVFKASITQPRNYKFLKKFFALIKFSYDAWDKPETQGAAKSFDVYRDELIVLSGHYDTVFSLYGNFKLVAKSISFAKMDEKTFSELYSAAIDVILTHVLKNYTKEDLDDVVENILRFD